MTAPRSLPSLFALDLRSLAALRAGIALVLLAQLLGMLPDLFALYSDSGVLTRSAAMAAAGPYRLSLYFLNGTTLFVALLWSSQCLAALALLLGWHSRWAAIFSFVGFASLLNRNPAVATQADALLLCLLFWLCLLPAGARWAVDAVADRRLVQEDSYRSWAVAGLRLQLALVFVVTALMQSGPAWHEQLSAFHDALQNPRHAALLGTALRDFPTLLALLTALSWWTQLLAPALLFAPKLARRVAIAALLLIQLVLALLFQLGAWPVLAALALWAFIGADFWEQQRQRYLRRHPGSLRVYYDEQQPELLRRLQILREFLLLPEAQLLPAQDTARARALLAGKHRVAVIDGAERAHLGREAALALLSHSALLHRIAPLLTQAKLARLTERLCGSLLARIERWMPSTSSLPARPYRAPERLALAALLLVLLANLATLQWLPAPLHRPVQALAQATALEQPWQLWSPAPRPEQTWIAVVGRSETGQEWDVLDPQGRAPRYEVAAIHDRRGGSRRHLLEQRLAEPGYAVFLPDYARYVCQRWLKLAPQQPLQQLRIVSMLQRRPASPDDSAPSAHLEQQVMLRQDCAEPSVRL